MIWEYLMKKLVALSVTLLTLSGCLARTELVTPSINPEIGLPSVSLVVEASPCSPGPSDDHIPCLVTAKVTEPTTHTDGRPITDLRGVRFSWTGDRGTNHYEGDNMFLDAPLPNGGHTHRITFYISVPKCGREDVRSRANAITHSGIRSEEVMSELTVDRRSEPGCS